MTNCAESASEVINSPVAGSCKMMSPDRFAQNNALPAENQNQQIPEEFGEAPSIAQSESSISSSSTPANAMTEIEGDVQKLEQSIQLMVQEFSQFVEDLQELCQNGSLSGDTNAGGGSEAAASGANPGAAGSDGGTTATTGAARSDGGTTATTGAAGSDGGTTATTGAAGSDGGTTATTGAAGSDGGTTATTGAAGSDGGTTTTTGPAGSDGGTTTTTGPAGSDGGTTPGTDQPPAPALSSTSELPKPDIVIQPTGNAAEDTQNIQNTINNSQPGEVIQFAPGTFQIDQALNFAGDRTYTGPGEFQWTGGSSSQDMMANVASGATLNGLTLSGAGIKLDDQDSNVNIQNCTIENINSGSGLQFGIYDLGGLSNSNITHNDFENINGDTAVMLGSPNDVNVDNNNFYNVNEAVHMVNYDANTDGNGVTVSDNTLQNIHRIGIEMQNEFNGLQVESNLVENWDRQVPVGQQDSHMALSIATAGGTGAEVSNNVLLGNGAFPQNADGNVDFSAIEFMGSGTVDNNYISNFGYGVLNGINTDGPWSLTNNTLVQTQVLQGNEGQGQDPSTESGNVQYPTTSGAPSAPDTAGADW